MTRWIKANAVAIIVPLLSAIGILSAFAWDAGARVTRTEEAIKANSVAIQNLTAVVKDLRVQLASDSKSGATMVARVVRLESDSAHQAERWSEVLRRLERIEAAVSRRNFTPGIPGDPL